MAGVRIYDVSNPRAPRLVKNVQTCKGSHTHTIVPSPKDKNIIYIYVSGSQGARPDTELAGCKERHGPGRPDELALPARRHQGAARAPGEGRGGDGRAHLHRARCRRRARRAGRRAAVARARRAARRRAAAAARRPVRATATTSRRIRRSNLLAGACGSYGLLVDISNPEKPVRLDAEADTNFSLWHTAVFSNDGKKVVFTDEWGGGTSPMCQATQMMEMGGNTILTIDANEEVQAARLLQDPVGADAREENCVSHNGGLIPVPGRDIMVQGWYQGGVSVMDFTDPDKPFELGVLRSRSDRSAAGADVPIAAAAQRGGRGTRGTIGGSWGAYYWNG